MITLNIAAHILIHVIVALHRAVKQGDKSSVKTILDSLTPKEQLLFLSTKDKKDESGKTAIQCAPADERKEIDKMLRQYMREADFEVNYGKFALFSHLAGFRIRKWHYFFSYIDIIRWINVYFQPLTTAYHLTDIHFRLFVVVRAKTNQISARNTLFRSFPLIVQERATLQTIKNECTSCTTVFRTNIFSHP